MSQQDRKFPPLWHALFRSTAQMSRTCAALSLGVLPAPPACFITPPQSRCRPRLPAAPHRAPNRMFQLVVCGTSQSSKPDVPGVRVLRLTLLQTRCSGGPESATSLLPNRLSTAAPMQQSSHSRAGARLPPITRWAPCGRHLLQPLRYHVEVGGTKVTPASYDFPGFPCSFSARWQRGTRRVGAPVLQGLICLSPVWLRTHIPGQGRSDYTMPCTASSLPVRLLVHLHV